MPTQPSFPTDFRALKSLEGKYKGKTTRPVDQSKLRVKVRPTARKQQEVKTVPMPSASGMLRTIGGIAANAPSALADLAVSVPKAAYDYARTTSPSGVLRDVKSAASDFANFVRENPGEAFVETVAGTPKAAGEMLREATLARDAGDEERAAQIEKLAVPMLLGSLIPGLGGKGGKKIGVIASEFGPDVARRLEGMVEESAPLAVWRKAAERISATEGSNAPRLTKTKQLGNAPYNPSEFDVKVRDKPATEATRGLYEEKKGVQQPPELSVENLIGRPFITSMADRTAAMRRLLGVNNTIFDTPVELLGGQDFMFDPTTQNLVWASEPGVVSNLRNMARVLADKYGTNPLYLPFRMGGSGSDFSTMTGETMMRYAADNMSKRDIASANKALQGSLPWKEKFAGIETPLGVEQYRNLPGKYRVDFARMLGNMAPQGGLTIGQTRLLIADPRQIDAPKFAVQNVGEIDPYAETVLGSGHPSFFGGLQGRGLGTLAEPDINVMELLPELAKRFRVTEPDLFSGSPTKLTPEEAAIHGASRMDPGYLLRTVPQSGVIDEEVVEELLRRRRERGE